MRRADEMNERPAAPQPEPRNSGSCDELMSLCAARQVKVAGQEMDNEYTLHAGYRENSLNRLAKYTLTC